MAGPHSNPASVTMYEIRLKGILPAEWSDWFDGITISHDAEGNTTLTCPLVDQAALYGMLDRLRDLGLHLLSVRQLAKIED